MFSLASIKFFDSYKIERKFYSLQDQVIRSSCSIGANIVEGKNSSSTKEMIRYFEIALRSSNETKYWLCLIRDAFQKDISEINQLIDEANQLSKIIAKSILTLRSKLLAKK